VLSSKRFKGKKSKEEFAKVLHENKYMIEWENGNFVAGTMFINKNEAKVVMYDNSRRNTTQPWYDYWVYEDANWYIDQPNRKTEYTLMLEKQGLQH
jgi:hypothetical protein